MTTERAKQNAATNVGIDWANPATLNGVLCHAVQAEPVANLHDNKTAVTEPHPMLSATG